MNDVDEDVVKPFLDLTLMSPTAQMRAVKRKALWKLVIGCVLSLVSFVLEVAIESRRAVQVELIETY